MVFFDGFVWLGGVGGLGGVFSVGGLVYSVLWVLCVESVTIRVARRVVEVVEEMVRLGIARSWDDAFSIIIEAGLPRVLELVERRKRVEELVDRFLREGLPYENLPTVEDVEEDRKR